MEEDNFFKNEIEESEGERDDEYIIDEGIRIIKKAEIEEGEGDEEEHKMWGDAGDIGEKIIHKTHRDRFNI
jgi:hypothetical protein